MVEDAVGEVIEVAVEALGDLGTVTDGPTRRGRRKGCGWFALAVLIVFAIAIGVALLNA